jgi:hypothetical protein
MILCSALQYDCAFVLYANLAGKHDSQMFLSVGVASESPQPCVSAQWEAGKGDRLVLGEIRRLIEAFMEFRRMEQPRLPLIRQQQDSFSL